jgi:DNA-binding GntR family transcriptional regulator
MARNDAQEYAYAAIKAEIVSLRLRPGSRIHAHDLAKKLKISRTPVREALGRLEHDGLIQKTLGWGYAVRTFGLQEIIDLFSVREILEVEAGLEALRYIDEVTIAKLGAILNRAEVMCSAGKLAEFRALNRQFHLLIGHTAQNELLNRMLLMLNDRILIVGSMHIARRKQRTREITRENRKILDALSSMQPKAVKSAILLHIRKSKVGLLQ